MTNRNHHPGQTDRRSRRARRAGIALALACLWVAQAPVQAKDVTEGTETTVSIPVANLEIDQATATISVLQDPPSSIQRFLRACQDNLAEILSIEDQETIDEMRTLCETAERWTTRHMPPPVHRLDAKGYSIRVPLKTPHAHIQAILWHAEDLDDVMAFMELLRSGALQSVTVFATLPWADDPSRPCTECPVKELVFHALEIQEHLRRGPPSEDEGR